MIVYLDTSVVLRVLLGQGRALKEWGRWQAAYSSELLGLEARRVVDRLRLELTLDDDGVVQALANLGQIERAIGHIALTRPVIHRASLSMATSVKTLDALHLASALLFRERRGGELIFATHDQKQTTAARAMGFQVIGA